VLHFYSTKHTPYLSSPQPSFLNGSIRNPNNEGASPLITPKKLKEKDKNLKNKQKLLVGKYLP